MSRILVIEPDLVLGKTYAAALRQEGHDVVLQHHAQTSISEIDRKKPDLIVLELQLPGHGGVEFLHELRSYGEWQDIPVLLQTFLVSKRITQHLERLYAMGITGYLYKPTVSLKQLVQTVNSTLRAV